jgi:hypothetical protein
MASFVQNAREVLIGSSSPAPSYCLYYYRLLAFGVLFSTLGSQHYLTPPILAQRL